jgi:hypothetical protein
MKSVQRYLEKGGLYSSEDEVICSSEMLTAIYKTTGAITQEKIISPLDKR